MLSVLKNINEIVMHGRRQEHNEAQIQSDDEWTRSALYNAHPDYQERIY